MPVFVRASEALPGPGVPRPVRELVRRAAEGDREAFDALYRMHVDRVYALCLRLAADRSRAEELTQDVFVRCWHRLTTFRGRSRFSTWLHRLAVNVALDGLRKDHRRNARTRPLELADGSSGRSTRPQTTEALMDLERAVAALPPRARTVVVLHDIEGFRYEEIAEMTGAALGTVKSQIHRGRRLLREMLSR